MATPAHDADLLPKMPTYFFCSFCGALHSGAVMAVPAHDADLLPKMLKLFFLICGALRSGAVMAVPAHDARDFEFAQKFGITPVQVRVCALHLRRRLAYHSCANVGPHARATLGGFNCGSSLEGLARICAEA
eukprot:1159421-Pelagomonas_calceolata.AAC.3